MLFIYSISPSSFIKQLVSLPLICVISLSYIKLHTYSDGHCTVFHWQCLLLLQDNTVKTKLDNERSDRSKIDKFQYTTFQKADKKSSQPEDGCIIFQAPWPHVHCQNKSSLRHKGNHEQYVKTELACIPLKLHAQSMFSKFLGQIYFKGYDILFNGTLQTNI